MPFFRLIRRHRDGTFTPEIPPGVIDLITSLSGQVDDLMSGDHPEAARLFPTAYNQDPELDAGYQILARHELIEQRRAHFAEFARTASESHLTEDELTSWMLVINDIRLVLGTILDTGSGDDEQVLAPNAPAPTRPAAGQRDPDLLASMQQAYEVLSVVLEHIVAALSSTLPDPDPDR